MLVYQRVPTCSLFDQEQVGQLSHRREDCFVINSFFHVLKQKRIWLPWGSMVVFTSWVKKSRVPCLDAGVQQIAIAGAFVHLLGDLAGDVHRTQLNRLIFFKVIRGVGDLEILMGNELNGEMTVILWWFYWSRESNCGEMRWIWIVILWGFHWELWWIVGENYGDTTITDKNQTWPAGKSLNQLSISTGKSSN